MRSVLEFLRDDIDQAGLWDDTDVGGTTSTSESDTGSRMGNRLLPESSRYPCLSP